MPKGAKSGDGLKSAALKSVKLDELVLYNSKLRFCAEQLQNLNFLFHKKLERKLDNNNSLDKTVTLAKSVTERLVQRLLCAAGILDARFASKFLIALNTHNQDDAANRKLEYLLRLDALSSPPVYRTDDLPKYSVIERDSDYPSGYARIRLNHHKHKAWSEFLNSSGYLRRDKVQARLVGLLAQAAAATVPDSPLQIDESVLCGAPGKILDPVSLHRMLQIPHENHVFYGPSGNVPRFPDPRDFRLAIVDEPDGIKLKVEFLSPAFANIFIKVRILVAVGIESWPSTTDFPSRVPLGHADCLLYHKAAQTGCYFVGFGVQSSGWQIRVPAAEYTILNHYGPSSTVLTILDLLYDVLEEIRNHHASRQHQISYKILNKYIMQTALLHAMEKDTSEPNALLLNWSPLYLSTLVLKILDRMILSLKDQKQPNYFFTNANLFVNPGHLCEDDFMQEAEKIQTYLLRLFDESLMSTKRNPGFKEMAVAQDTETLLLCKWKDVVNGLLPPSTARRRFCLMRSKSRSCSSSQYSSRQMEYIGLLLKNVLTVKQSILQPSEEIQWGATNGPNTDVPDDPLEDVVYLLVTIIEQARDQYLEHLQRTLTITKNKSKFKLQFNTCTSKLVETVRKDKESSNLDLQDDVTLVKTILKWLYKGLEQNKTYMGPVLRPYLQTLFLTSHAVSWHLDYLKNLSQTDEIEALGAFAYLVNEGKITPAQGLLDAVGKNWNWAKSMLNLVEIGNLRLVFIPGRGIMLRHILSMPNSKRNEEVDGSKTLQQRSKVENVESRRLTLPSRNYFNTILKQTEAFKQQSQDNLPIHDVLKNESPLNLLLNSTHRRGDHRCCGDLLQALLSIQKINVLQDVSSHLLEEDRVELLETIHKLTNTRTKAHLNKRWSTSLPHFNKARLNGNFRSQDLQKYTPKEESAGIPIAEDLRRCGRAWDKESLLKKFEQNQNTLIGSCRAARIREDNSILKFQDNFKVKSLLRKKESFKL